MGVMTYTVARILLYGLAALSGLAANILLARRLEPVEFSFYQSLMKRLYFYINIGQGVIQFWLYRYAVVEGFPALLAGLLVSASTAIAGLAVGWLFASMLHLDQATSLLAGAALAAALLWPTAYTVIDAVRPIRSAIAMLLLRSIYGLLVIGGLCVLRGGLREALIATAAAYALAVLVAFRWALEKLQRRRRPRVSNVVSLAVEWLKASYSTIPSHLGTLIYSLDVAVAYLLRSPLLVAGFFVSSAASNIVSDVVMKGLRYLHSYTIRTSDSASALRATRATAMIAAPLLAYIVVYPAHYVYLLNPAYAWASPAASIAAYAALASIVVTGFTQTAFGLVLGSASEAARGVARVSIVHLVAAIAYIALVGVALATPWDDASALIGWAIAFTILHVTKIVLLYPLVPAGEARRTVFKSLILYPLVALVVSLAAPPQGPPTPSFWETLWAVVPSILIVYAVYTAVLVLVDVEAKSIVAAAGRRVAEKLVALRGRRASVPLGG